MDPLYRDSVTFRVSLHVSMGGTACNLIPEARLTFDRSKLVYHNAENLFLALYEATLSQRDVHAGPRANLRIHSDIDGTKAREEGRNAVSGCDRDSQQVSGLKTYVGFA